ncbi:TraR/DksA family transcriptional regulator [Microbispora hainanensis]|uniref:TraR/DksA family transcriptional regulator n=1 Tax=Microbispora hainanensis TaxID=568844 RepID=UPI0033F74A1F
MAEIRSPRLLMEECRRYSAQLSELRTLLEERLHAAVGEAATIEVAEIEAALERMERGLYGTCTRCEAFLPLDRLRRMPHVQVCASCAGETRLSA